VTVLPSLIELEGAWRDMAVQVRPYVAACGWHAPPEPTAAARWLLTERRLSFLHPGADFPVISSLRRSQMVVLSRAGAEFGSVGEVFDHMLQVAFLQIGIRRLELPLLETWVAAIDAARAMGFQVEGCFPEACFAGGRYRDLLLLAIMASEWRR
jgi:hypothetical protein